MGNEGEKSNWIVEHWRMLPVLVRGAGWTLGVAAAVWGLLNLADVHPDWQTILGYIRTLRWPLLTGAVLYGFRDPVALILLALKDRIADLTEATMPGGVSVKFLTERASDSVVTAAARVIAPATIEPAAEPASASARDIPGDAIYGWGRDPDVFHGWTRDPGADLQLSWRRVVAELELLGRTVGLSGDLALDDLVDALVAKKAIRQDLVDAYRDLAAVYRALSRRATRRQTTPDTVRSFRESCFTLALVLRAHQEKVQNAISDGRGYEDV